MSFHLVLTTAAAVCLCLWSTSGTRDHMTPSGHKFPQYNNNVWVLGEQYGYTDKYDVMSTGCDTTNVAALTMDHMHVDYYTTVENLRMIRFNLELPADFVQIRMINEEEQDEVFVAVHEGHMTINRFGNYTTFPIPVKKSSSLFMIENLACVVPATSTLSDNTTHILCTNVVHGTFKMCPNNITPGSHGYADVLAKTQVAFVVSGEVVQIFKVDDDCVSMVGGGPSRNYGNGMWFSYEGSRVFLNDGLTLGVGDLSSMGTLGSNPIGRFKYNWISQLYRTELLNRDLKRGVVNSVKNKRNANLKYDNKNNRPIMSLRDDVMDKVFYYAWPSLDANGTEAIPVPSGYSLVRPISLQYCQPDFAYAMVTYREKKTGTFRTGVAYVKHDWSD